MIYGKSLDYLKLFWGSGKTWWNEAKQIVTMKVTMEKKEVSACSDVEKKKDTLDGFPVCNRFKTTWQEITKSNHFYQEHLKCSEGGSEVWRGPFPLLVL